MTGRKRSGFTLIELLVVIAIIGILTTIGAYTYQTGQARARDTQRKADLQTIASALERYYADHGFYPDSFFNSPLIGDAQVYGQFNFYISSSTTKDWIWELSSYLTPLPQDPKQVAFKIDWLAKFLNHPSLTFPPQVSAAGVDYHSCVPPGTQDKVFGTGGAKNDADINGDGIVDNRDSLTNLSAFGHNCLESVYNVNYDMDNNGSIDLSDALIVLAHTGSPQLPTGSYFYSYRTPLEIPSGCLTAPETTLACLKITHPHRSYILWARLENKNDPEIWTSQTAKCREDPNLVSNFPAQYKDTGYCITSSLPARY